MASSGDDGRVQARKRRCEAAEPRASAQRSGSGGGLLPELSAQSPPAPSPARRYSQEELPGTGEEEPWGTSHQPFPYGATGKPQIGIAEGRTGQAVGSGRRGAILSAGAEVALGISGEKRGVAAAVEAAAAAAEGKEEASNGGVADWLPGRLGPAPRNNKGWQAGSK